MRKYFVAFLIFFSLCSVSIAADVAKPQGTAEQKSEQGLREDFKMFLEQLYSHRESARKEAETIIEDMKNVINETNNLIDSSRTEIKNMSYSETRNVLIASIFLWVSITIFIVMNLIFANNLKKELYFLRNGLLRSEIKDNMVALSEQLEKLNKKLDAINKEE